MKHFHLDELEPEDGRNGPTRVKQMQPSCAGCLTNTYHDEHSRETTTNNIK